MIEFLVASAQALCLAALLYGAYFVVWRGSRTIAAQTLAARAKAKERERA